MRAVPPTPPPPDPICVAPASEPGPSLGSAAGAGGPNPVSNGCGGHRRRCWAPEQGRGDSGGDAGRRNGVPAKCHDVSCFVMRAAGNVMFRHGPPRLRRHRHPSPSCMPFLHRISFRSLLPAAGSPPSGGSLFRAYRAPASARAGARILRRRAFRAPDCAYAHERTGAGRTFPVGSVECHFPPGARRSGPRMPLPPALILTWIPETQAPFGN